MNRMAFLFLILIAASCSRSNCWELEEIAAGDRSFDSTRLKYQSPDPSPLEFEMLRVGQNVEAFLSMKRGRFYPSGPESNLVKASFKIGEESFDEEIPLREGGMKIRLSLETANRLTQALQEGKNVSILIGDTEQMLEADRFSRTFSWFLGKSFQDENLFKGLIQ